MRRFSDCSLRHFTAFMLSTAVLFAPTPAKATDGIPEDLQPGRVIERVVCKNNPDQSYALYLPSNYSSARKWPLLAAFDPAARGNLPIEYFREAAERFGYIVCGSNNSRNGPLQPSAEAAQSMLIDVAARFSIDDRRVYLTGFSGGARAASAIAVWLKEGITGVIGCGAGFAAGIEPSSSLPFVFYGTVGVEDFNYPEMKQLDRKLQSAGIAHRIEVFEGGHGWAPADSCVRALEWMELQAMKSGRRTRDEGFIERVYKSAQDKAVKEEAAGRLLEAYDEYVGIAADFKALRDVSEFEKRAVLLKDSKSVKQALKKAQDQENEEIRRALELTGLRARLTTLERGAQTSGSNSETGERQVTFSELKNKLKELKRKSEAAEDTPERAYARRVLSQYNVAAFEQSMMLLQARKYDLAASNLVIDAELMPDNWRILYYLACTYSLKGDKRRAIETLTKAVEKGFANAAELERNDQLDGIRDEAGFKKIIEGLKQKR